MCNTNYLQNYYSSLCKCQKAFSMIIIDKNLRAHHYITFFFLNWLAFLEITLCSFYLQSTHDLYFIFLFSTGSSSTCLLCHFMVMDFEIAFLLTCKSSLFCTNLLMYAYDNFIRIGMQTICLICSFIVKEQHSNVYKVWSLKQKKYKLKLHKEKGLFMTTYLQLKFNSQLVIK